MIVPMKFVTLVLMRDDREAVLRARLEEEVAPYGQVVSTLCSSRETGEGLEVTLRAECRESIGKLVPIYVDETEGTPPS